MLNGDCSPTMNRDPTIPPVRALSPTDRLLATLGLCAIACRLRMAMAGLFRCAFSCSGPSAATEDSSQSPSKAAGVPLPETLPPGSPTESHPNPFQVRQPPHHSPAMHALIPLPQQYGMTPAGAAAIPLPTSVLSGQNAKSRNGGPSRASNKSPSVNDALSNGVRPLTHTQFYNVTELLFVRDLLVLCLPLEQPPPKPNLVRHRRQTGRHILPCPNPPWMTPPCPKHREGYRPLPVITIDLLPLVPLSLLHRSGPDVKHNLLPIHHTNPQSP